MPLTKWELAKGKSHVQHGSGFLELCTEQPRKCLLSERREELAIVTVIGEAVVTEPLLTVVIVPP